MVLLNKIYTRTGDDGTSALGTGERRPKSDLRFQAIGTVDEVNAAIGLARLSAEGAAVDPMLARIQNDLFDLGADLAVPQEGRRHERLRIIESQVTRLETEIDALNDSLQPLTSFILPGGSPLAAALHFARTVTRRAERIMVDLDAYEPLNPAALTYVNRLSDFLFVAARMANDGGAGDVLWVPGENR
jgi:cob(I)alamin adenosyltransferase